MKSFDDELVHKTVRELFDILKSKQAEVDELQKRVDDAIALLEYNEYVDSPLQALEVLKGDSHES